MLGRVRGIIDRNEQLLAESLDSRNVDGHIAKRGGEGPIRRCTKAKTWHEVRRADDDGALDPAIEPSDAAERACGHRPRVSVARVRGNHPAWERPFVDRDGRKKVDNGLA